MVTNISYGYIASGSTGATGATGAQGYTGAQGFTGSFKSVGITGTTGYSNTAGTANFFNEVNQVTGSSQYLIIVSVEFFASSSSIVALTIGRGTTSTPDNTYYNLANNTQFSITDIQLVGNNTQDNLLTSLQQNNSQGNNNPLSMTIQFIDTGLSSSTTYYYAVRQLSDTSSKYYNFNFYVLGL